MPGVVPRFDFTLPPPDAAALGRVHFIAIGGSGMSGVARLLADAGVAVDGCDQAVTSSMEQLRAAGLEVRFGHDPRHLDAIDTVVVSSAIPESNVELAAARVAGRVVLHRAQALAAAMAGRTRIAVAGANGKTTTSAMTVSALRAARADPSFAIGSELIDLGANSHTGTGRVFIAEADESDGSFLSYRPHIAVVTNVQPDHLDFYGDLANVEAAYAAFADSIEPGGLLVASADDPGAVRLTNHRRAAGGRVVTYGESASADLVIKDLDVSALRARARVTSRHHGVELDLTVRAPGRHNVHNAVAALAVGWLGLDLTPSELLAGLAHFPGTRRRFEERGTAGGVTVVDDYAHNAPKVAALVATAVALRAPGTKIRVVFQPHLFSRTRDFATEFAEALAGADDVVLLGVYGAREEPMPGVSSELIAAPLRQAGCRVRVLDDHDAAVAYLARSAQPGDLVLTVGAGDVTSVGPMLLDTLRTERR